MAGLHNQIIEQKSIIFYHQKIIEQLEIDKSELISNLTNVEQLYNNLQTEKSTFDKQLGLLNQEISAREKQILEKDQLNESQKNEISYQNLSLDSTNSTVLSLKETITDLENKVHKIGQTEQTIFLNSQRNNKDYYSKEGLGFQNPCNFNKAYGTRPSLYSYEVQQMVDKYPEF